MSEDASNALNALLFHTGTATSNFCMVLATNRPADLDFAVVDRVDEMIEFPLPGYEERLALIKLYFDKYVRKAPKIVVSDDVGMEEHRKIAAKTEGYSGRALSKLMITVQGHVYGKEEGATVLGRDELMEVIKTKMESFDKRDRLMELQEGYVGE